MIEEVVNSILEAEDVAEKRVAEAKSKANDIVVAAENKADAFKKKSSAENKENFVSKIKDAEVSAQKQADVRLAEMKKVADDEAKIYSKNTEAAVKIILEKLL